MKSKKEKNDWRCVIGTGNVVTKNIHANSLAVGNLCKKVVRTI